MPQAVRILMVEDVELDQELAVREMKRAGMHVDVRRVEREDDFRRELAGFRPHVILSDFAMPQFDGMAALGLARELAPDTPFIFVSGTLGEEYAIRALKQGATDYVLKGNLLRLPPAVQRAVDDARVRAMARRAEEDLRRFRLAMDNSADMVVLIDRASMRFVDVNAATCRLLGYSREELLAMGPQDVLPVSREALEKSYEEMIAAPNQPNGMNSHYRCRDGSLLPFESTRCALRSGDSWIIVAVSRDIRARIAAEKALRASEEGVRRLNRLYAVLSGINALVVRIRDRDELFRETCRLAVHAGRFIGAWIGVVDRAAMRVQPVAWHGMAQEYIEAMPLSLDPSTEQYSLAGEVLNARRPIVVDDMATDGRVVLKAQAREKGLHSLVMLPLTVNGNIVAVLAVYAREIGVFDAAEMKLLRELGDDIGFALEYIDKTKALEYLSYYDPLTGLANRSLLMERLSQSLDNAKREGRGLGLVLLDLERFKTVNDSLGRKAGDELLSALGKRLVQIVGGDERRVAHIGADRFAVLTPGVRSAAQLARPVEEGLSRTASEPFVLGGTEVRVSAKAGIAIFPDDAGDADTLFRNAEAALKKTKEAGERYLFYAQDMTARVAERLQLENRLRQAIEREEFVLYYQPKTDVGRRRIVGVEALIRWQSPDLGFVAPGRFIPMLEETGLILQVGAWALQRAVREHCGWVERGLAAPRIAVNVSPIQLRQRNFVRVLTESLSGGAVPAGIDLEITESLIMEDVENTIAKLQEVRTLGIGIAIDDFGTGYSSLAYLTRLPAQTLKVDRSFVTAMQEDPNSATLVHSVVSLAHSLGLQVVAEGVETPAQLERLAAMGCDQIQGYLFAKPMPAAELVVLLQKHSEHA